MKHGTMLMIKKPIHGLKKTQLAVEELSGDHKGLQMFQCVRLITMASHLGKGNVLLYCMRAARMVGSPITPAITGKY